LVESINNKTNNKSDLCKTNSKTAEQTRASGRLEEEDEDNVFLKED
jgi:hypothetical protein